MRRLSFKKNFGFIFVQIIFDHSWMIFKKLIDYLFAKLSKVKKARTFSQYLDSRLFAKNRISTRSYVGTPTGSHSTKNFSTFLFCERKYFSFQVSAQFCPIRIRLLKFIEFFRCRKRELAEISRGSETTHLYQ